MGVTGYEVRAYADLSSIARSLEEIASALRNDREIAALRAVAKDARDRTEDPYFIERIDAALNQIKSNGEERKKPAA